MNPTPSTPSQPAGSRTPETDAAKVVPFTDGTMRPNDGSIGNYPLTSWTL